MTATPDGLPELGKAVVSLLIKEPFFAHLLGGIPRRMTDRVETAAVALTPWGPELLVNSGFFLSELDVNERVGVLKHEVLHLVFRHLYRPLFKQANAALFNIAADLVVNQHISPWPLPESAVTLRRFPDLRLLPNQSLEWYYEKLVSLKNEIDQHGVDGCSAKESAHALARIVGIPCHGDHHFWAGMGGDGFASADGAGNQQSPKLTETMRRTLEADLERHLLRARDRLSSRQWGTLPAQVQSALTQIAEQRNPIVDWRRTLRLFTSGGFRTSIVATKRRMSKRFGTFPGVRIKREKNIAVVLDTSGSIDQKAVEAFFREVHGVWKSGAGVTIIECDAAVQRSYAYTGEVPKSVRGGGGTDFDPAFAWLRDFRNGRYDACLYLTDGFGPAPAVRPRCPLLWVVCDKGGLGEHLKWGRSILLKLDS